MLYARAVRRVYAKGDNAPARGDVHVPSGGGPGADIDRRGDPGHTVGHHQGSFTTREIVEDDEASIRGDEGSATTGLQLAPIGRDTHPLGGSRQSVTDEDV